MRTAFLFPGSGVQYKGMGSKLFDNFTLARETYVEAEDLLKLPLTKWCFSLEPADISQIHLSIYVTSIALFRVMSEECPLLTADFMTGHSLGEFSALTCAGSLTFQEGLALVSRRAEIIQQWAGSNTGVMAVNGLDQYQLQNILTTSPEQEVYISCHNSRTQHTLSGNITDLEKVANRCRDHRADVTFLNVPFPTHCPLLTDASDEFKQALQTVKFGARKTTVISNVSGKPYDESSDLHEELAKHLCRPVQWQSTMEYMISAGVSLFVDVGPRSVLKNITADIRRGVRTLSFDDDTDRVTLSADFDRQRTIGRMLAMAVASQNSNPDYNQVFEESRKRYQFIADLRNRGTKTVAAQDLRKAMVALDEIFEMKQVPAQERSALFDFRFQQMRKWMGLNQT